MALWIYATTESISSAREIDRRCNRDLAFKWICRGVSVNYHLIADFRSQDLEFLQKTLVTTVASLPHANVVTLETVAQDGMRVRANAGSSSFRRKAKLEACVEQARAHVEKMNQQEQDAERTKAPHSAQERSAQEKLVRAEEALRQVQELEQDREAAGIKVYAPIHGKQAMENRGTDPYARQRWDTDEYFRFRQRMATQEAQEIYQRRPAIAEYPNAEFRNRGLTQFRVRGLSRVLASTLLYALSFNFMRAINLNLIK